MSLEERVAMVNNAGVLDGYWSVDEMDEALWRRVIDIYHGPRARRGRRLDGDVTGGDTPTG